MSNPYYPHQPPRQPAYDNPLNPPHSRPPFPQSNSNQSMLRHHEQDGVDYHHFHSQGPQPYHDPYATLMPNHEYDLSSNDTMNPQISGYSKEMHPSSSDEGNDSTLRIAGGTQYVLAKDEEGRIGHGRGHRIEATDGLLPDMPPDMDRLNPEQKEIMKQFPPDLDDEGGGKSGMQAAMAMLKDWRSYFRLKYLHWWIMLILVIALVALTTIYHKQIVDWLTPISQKVTTVAWGWIIPVAILFIISFPPLFGHEIVLILVGLVYGIWIGFGIASLGTLLGEIGNFYAFKHCLRSMAAKHERKNIHYACMAEMVRDGGFWVMFLARLSAIPGHFTTAVFATVGMNIFIFTFAAILALPKQLLIVYLGVAIKNSGNGSEDTKSKVIKYVVLAISVIITLWTAHWLYQRMEKVRPEVSARLRQKRYELLLQARTPGTEGYMGEDRGERGMYTYPPTAPPSGGPGAVVDASYVYRPQSQMSPPHQHQHQQHMGSPGSFAPPQSYDAPRLQPGQGRMHFGGQSRPGSYAPQPYDAPRQEQGPQGRPPFSGPLRSDPNNVHEAYDQQGPARVPMNATAPADSGAPERMPRSPRRISNLYPRVSTEQQADGEAQAPFAPISQRGASGESVSAGGGRAAITAPLQFHRPIRAATGGSSPFHEAPSDGFGPTPARSNSKDDETAPLTNAAGEWTSGSSLATSPVDGPPEYRGYASSQQGHPRALQPNNGGGGAQRVEAGIQRYTLSD